MLLGLVLAIVCSGKEFKITYLFSEIQFCKMGYSLVTTLGIIDKRTAAITGVIEVRTHHLVVLIVDLPKGIFFFKSPSYT